MTEDRSITRAREEIYEALRFLAPHVAEGILKQLYEDMKKLADKYDRLLQELVS